MIKLAVLIHFSSCALILLLLSIVIMPLPIQGSGFPFSEVYLDSNLDSDEYLLTTKKPIAIGNIGISNQQRDGSKSKSQRFAPVQEETSATGALYQWGLLDKWKELLCIVKSRPEAAFVWELNGSKIDSYYNQSMIYNITTPRKNWSLLQVKLTDKSVLGKYTCRAETDLGAAERNFILGLAEGPPIPTFHCEGVPDKGIQCQILQLDKPKPKLVPSFLEELKKLNDVEDENKTPNLEEVLPVRKYAVQIRIFRSCDAWTNYTMDAKDVNESGLWIKNVESGLEYRIRMATITEAGTGDYSRAKTVEYL